MMLTPEELREVIPNPQKTIKELDKYIIGQQAAKRVLALMLVSRALNRLDRANKIWLDQRLEKLNVLLLGNTGTGKTALVKSLAEISGVPISITDMTSITSSGYIGGKVEDILVRHVKEARDYVKANYQYLDIEAQTEMDAHLTRDDMVRELTENGLVYLDEIDKICIRELGRGADINGDMVQNELLKILESGNVNLRSSTLDRDSLPMIEVRTDNIMFICGGAFNGLSDIIKQRLNKSRSIGFNSEMDSKLDKNNEDDLLQYVTTEDLLLYGFKPEFLGRIPLRATLEPMTPKIMKQIIMNSKNSIFKQYASIFQVFGIELQISKAAIKEIATLASDLKMGARALKPVFHKLLEEPMLNLWNFPKNKNGYLITATDVRKLGEKI